MVACYPPPHQRAARTLARAHRGKLRIAIIIDDLGLDQDAANRVLDLPAPLTLAIMSYAKDAPALAHTAALKEDFEATGALGSDTEDVINLTLAVAGTEVAVILVEQPSGSFKISFRSRTPKVDCSELAKSFGGGGHKAAAGASINAPWPEAQRKVLDAVRSAMR